MASLKEVKTRIASVESTKKITQARQMISSAQLHRAQGLLESAKQYRHSLEALVTVLMDSDKSFESQLIAERENGAVAVIVMASNSGMCGAFNTKMAKEASSLAKQQHDIVFYPIGKKIREALADCGHSTPVNLDHLAGKCTFEDVAKLADELMNSFLSGKIKRVDLLHYHYRNMAAQDITRKTLLPYALPHSDAMQVTTDYIFEPSREQIQRDILPQTIRSQLFESLSDTRVSEHAARTIAMQLATESANDILDELHLSYNKLRQQNITSELLDIVGGSFA